MHNWPRYLANIKSSTELMDLDFDGPSFTWRGTINGDLMEERVDKGLINRLW